MNEKSYVGEIQSNGIKMLNLKDLAKPLQNSDAVANVFCENCGSLLEINQAGAESLVEISNEDVLDFSKKYFITSGCALCNSDKNISVHIKDIPII